MKPLKIGDTVALYQSGRRFVEKILGISGEIVTVTRWPSPMHRKQCRLITTKKKSVRVTREKLCQAWNKTFFSSHMCSHWPYNNGQEYYEALCKALGLDEGEK